MPLYQFNDEEERRRYLLSKGIDPDKYDLAYPDEPVEAPVVAPKMSTIGAAGYGARRALGATAGGLGGMALGMLAAPATGGLSLAIPLAAGFGGGYLGGKVQQAGEEALMSPESYAALQEKYATAEEEHPVASFVGGMAPQLAALRPSPSLLRSGASILRGGLNRPLSQAQRIAASNIALGAGLGAGTEAVGELISGRELSPGHILGSAAAGALLHEPTMIGRKLGFPSALGHDVVSGDVVTPPEAGLSTDKYKFNYPARQKPFQYLNPEEISQVYPSAVERSGAIPPSRAEQISAIRTTHAEANLERLKAAHEASVAKQEAVIQQQNQELAQNIYETQQSKAVHENALLNKNLSKLAEQERLLSAEPGSSESKSGVLSSIKQNKDIENALLEKKAMEEHNANEHIALNKAAEVSRLKANAEEAKAKFLSGEQLFYQKQAAEKAKQAAPLVTGKLASVLGHEGVKVKSIAEGLPDQARGATAPLNPREVLLNTKEGEAFDVSTIGHELSHSEVFEGLLSKDTPKAYRRGLTKALEVMTKRLQNEQPQNKNFTIENLHDDILNNNFREGSTLFHAIEKLGSHIEPAFKGDITVKPNSFFSDFISNLKFKAGIASAEDVARLQVAGFKYRAGKAEIYGEKFVPRSDIVSGKVKNIPKIVNQPAEVKVDETKSPFDKMIEAAEGRVLSKEEIDKIKKEHEVDVVKEREKEFTKEPTKYYYQPKREDFFLESNKELIKDKPFGLTPSKTGELPVQSVRSRLANQLSKGEKEALDAAGLDKFLEGKKSINVKELSKWIGENGPKVEVKKYNAGGPSIDNPLQKRFFELQHELDSAPHYRIKAAVEDALHFLHEDPMQSDALFREALEAADTLPSHTEELANQKALWRNRVVELETLAKNPELEKAYKTRDLGSATARFTGVNPKPLKDMPGAVDILVKVPVIKPAEYKKTGLGGNVMVDKGEGIKFQEGSHFPNDPNVVAFSRGYMENLPNGKKVFHVFEAQSDWASAVRRKKAGMDVNEYDPNVPPLRDADDPLLAYYENLAMKTSIQHALSNGADAIAISDSKTAMMTEGHDKNVRSMLRVENIPYNPELLKKLKYDYNAARSIEENGKVINIEPSTEEQAEYIAKTYGGNIVTRYSAISQEGGMVQHYDHNLPNIAKKLTGYDGKPVSFGQHQNGPSEAFGGKSDVTARIYPLDNAREKLKLLGDQYPLFKQPRELKYASGINEKVDFESLLKHPDYQKPRITKELMTADTVSLPIFRDSLTKIKQAYNNGKEAKSFTDAVNEFLNVFRMNEGRYRNPSLIAAQSLNLRDQTLLYDTMIRERRARTSYRETLPENIKPIYDEQRRVFRLKQEEQIEAGEMVKDWDEDGKMYYRKAEIDEFYFPNIMGRHAQDILMNHPNSNAAESLKADFITLQKELYNWHGEVGDAKANKIFDEFMESYHGGKVNVTRFGAVRQAEGIGLPDTWLEPNLQNTLSRYWRRVSSDRAFHDVFEKDHNLLKIIGQKHDAYGELIQPTDPSIKSIASNEEVGRVLDIITGQSFRRNPTVDALSRVASGLILGPTTGITDFMSSLPLISKYAPRLSDIPGLIYHSLVNIPTGIKNAIKTGNIKQNMSAYEEALLPTTERAEKLNALADGINKINGRTMLERWSRGLTQSAGEYIVKLYRPLAESGNKKALDFLEKLSMNEAWKTLSDEELATRISQFTQGTYDVRGLPAWAIDSPISPFFRLSRWSIEQSNNFMKHVITPAVKQNNYTPLIASLFGSIAGGYMIREMRELISGKKLQVPEIDEIRASGGLTNPKNIPESAYNLMAAVSYVGVLGIVGDIIKSAFDIKFKNAPQGFNYPLFEIGADVANRTAQATQAIIEGTGNPVDVAKEYAKDLFTANTQVGRLTINWLGSEDDKANISAKRNIRMFSMLNDLPYAALGTGANLGENKYASLASREFKKATTVEEAKQSIPQLAKNISRLPSIEAQQRAIRGLKTMPVTTFPSPTSRPVEFRSYLNYLRSTQGEEAAQKALNRYRQQQLVNRAKSRSLVPLVGRRVSGSSYQ